MRDAAVLGGDGGPGLGGTGADACGLRPISSPLRDVSTNAQVTNTHTQRTRRLSSLLRSYRSIHTTMLCRRNAGKRVKLATLEAVTGSRAAGFLCCEALTLTTLVPVPVPVQGNR